MPTTQEALRVWCSCCEDKTLASIRPGNDSKTGEPFSDLCCNACHLVIATFAGHPALATPPTAAVQRQHDERDELLDQCFRALAVADCIIDAIPHRLHEAGEEGWQKHIGKLVNDAPLEDGKTGYRYIADAFSALKARNAKRWADAAALSSPAPQGEEPGEQLQRIATECGDLEVDSRGRKSWEFDEFGLVKFLRLAAPDTPEPEVEALRRDAERMRRALARIERWFDEFPETGKFWDEEKTQSMSYGAAFGSNGERDYMRGVARAALRQAPVDGGATPSAAERDQ